MVTLIPMQQDDFELFLEHGIRQYAENHVRSRNWPATGALERSKKEFEHYLPDGIHSQDQYLWSLVDEGNNKIGSLWVQVKEHRAFIFDFVIDEQFRGRGYGKQALTALDEKLKSMSAESVALHVFGDNIAAQELYKKMGFKIVGINMNKDLA
jgi:ribosomal protein S18 acetylase RimI-like enzyme